MSLSLSAVVLSLNEQDKEQLQVAGLSSSALSDSWKQPPAAALSPTSSLILHPACPISFLPELERRGRSQSPTKTDIPGGLEDHGTSKAALRRDGGGEPRTGSWLRVDKAVNP